MVFPVMKKGGQNPNMSNTGKISPSKRSPNNTKSGLLKVSYLLIEQSKLSK